MQAMIARVRTTQPTIMGMIIDDSSSAATRFSFSLSTPVTVAAYYPDVDVSFESYSFDSVVEDGFVKAENCA